ncbi:hypothetical protein ASPCAL05933 [Aspergillus calidoustus]|uniref:Uncharacterized protein n=1 Tax=Aspergillus calidoustus TaxID=454130 RepID=A0A0U5G312_ASPCI|nr:hypothetical protein ASPCAL05933 [Aspergillus calidoustus]
MSSAASPTTPTPMAGMSPENSIMVMAIVAGICLLGYIIAQPFAQRYRARGDARFTLPIANWTGNRAETARLLGLESTRQCEYYIVAVTVLPALDLFLREGHVGPFKRRAFWPRYRDRLLLRSPPGMKNLPAIDLANLPAAPPAAAQPPALAPGTAGPAAPLPALPAAAGSSLLQRATEPANVPLDRQMNPNEGPSSS